MGTCGLEACLCRGVGLCLAILYSAHCHFGLGILLDLCSLHHFRCDDLGPLAALAVAESVSMCGAEARVHDLIVFVDRLQDAQLARVGDVLELSAAFLFLLRWGCACPRL